MAKKSSNRRSKKFEIKSDDVADSPVEDVVEDAEVVEAAAEVVADPVEETVPEAVPEEPEAVEAVEDNDVDTTPYEAPTPQPPAPEKQNSFVPLVIGGVIAGIIGYGVATLQGGDNTDALSSTIAAQSSEIETLRGDITTLAERPEPDGITAEELAGVQTSLDALTARFDESFATLDARMTAVEKQPSADGTLQETAIAAYESDIAELRDQISAQQEELRALLSDTRQEAQAIEENAIASARNATARASLAIVQAALETGAPMGAALIDLDGATTDPVPAALMDASNGVASLAALQADFPALARSALATARSEGVSGEDEGGLSGFLRNQLDVRSVEPKDGDGADAVLSRAEAALREGRLNDTLAELGSLPEVARADLSDWIAQAETRAAALDAAATLASQLNVN